MVTYPSDWRTYPFKKFFRLIPNNTLPRDKLSSSGTIGNIHYGDVLIKYGDTISDQDDIPRIREDIDFAANNLLQKNDVIIADTAEDETVGKVTQVGDVSIPLVGGLHTVVCRPNIETAEGYLGCYMNSRYYHDQLLPYITGIKVSSVSKKSLNETELTVPANVDEQREIIKVFHEMDGHIANLSELIEKKRGIRDGALEDMMSGRIRLQGFTADWGVYPFSKYFSLLPTNTCSRDQLSDRGQVGDIHYGDILIKYGAVLSDADEIPRLKDVSRIKERSFLKMHDVLIADTAEDETVGKIVQVGKVSIPLVGGLHTVACRPNYETAEGFLGYYMNSSQYHEQLYPYITGIKVSSISKKSFGETELCIPAEVEEQKAIVSVLKAMDEEIEALEVERDKMIQIREGAMDDLLTGRVRLSV